MALLKRKPPSVEEASALIARLEATLSQSRAELEDAQKRFGEASLAFEEDGSPEAKVEREHALKALERVKAQFSEAEATLVFARERHKETITLEEERKRKEAWAEVRQILKKREELATKLTGTLSQAFKQFEELQELGPKAYRSAPKKDVANWGESFMTPSEAVRALRAHLRKMGWKWAATSVWDETKLVTLEQSIAGANAVLLKQEN